MVYIILRTPVTFKQKEQRMIKRILLWHCQLGHPSFSYLEHLFPKLFSTIFISSLRSEQFNMQQIIVFLLRLVSMKVPLLFQVFILMCGDLSYSL